MVYMRVLAAVLAALFIKGMILAVPSASTLTADVHGIGSFVEVLGGLYSIVVAFLIYVVWDQFNRVQTGINQEGAALEDLCRVAAFLSDRNQVRPILSAARQYMESTSGDEPKRLAGGELSRIAEEQFGVLCRSVRGAEVKTKKDEAIYSAMLGSLTRISDSRDDRLAVSATRIPRTLWNLVVYASIALFGGFLVLGIHSAALSLAVTAAVAGTLVFLLSVVLDMDNPFTGAWNVSYAPFRSIAARIAQQ